MITGEHSVVKAWLHDGASGWRLDVADELPDDVLRDLRTAAKQADPDSVLLGEVWEDAVTKVSYGARRQYALGDALDSVMNYPLRDALILFLTGRSTARALADLLLSQRLNYPQPLYYALMNLTASHDVARTRSALALDFDPRSRTRAQLAALDVTDAMAARGAQLQLLAAAVQFWLPGIPSIYYGDEAGMQGLCDPFNRAPLQMCDTQMLQWYAKLSALRHAHPALQRGEIAVFAPAGDVVCITAKGKPIKAKTLGQRAYLDAIEQNTITIGVGPAGTGKTYLAVAEAVAAFRAERVNRIILTRPAVEAGERLGFLPGDLQNKVDPYLRPLYDALFEMLGADAYAKYLERGNIEVAPLAYMRGRTLDDSFIILDEAQNTSREQMKMFLTRIGFGSHVVITGDVTQIDLPSDKPSGLKEALRILDGIDDIAICRLTGADVVRHALVQKIIAAYEKDDKQREKHAAAAAKKPAARKTTVRKKA